MKEAAVLSASSPKPEPARGDQAFDELEQTLRTQGAQPALDRLIEQLDAVKEYRALLDAIVLKARHELGLPLFHSGPLSNLPEPERTQFEERYVDAIRLVGGRFLAAGDIPSAWAYFRAIAEPRPVALALDAYEPGDDPERLSQIIDIALYQGANTRRGFELVLNHYGTCSAITALEQVSASDENARVACVERLIRHLHEQLVANLRGDIAQRGQPLPDEGTSIAGLVATRDWLFADEAYHIDVSHLASTVRYSLMASDPAVLALAVDLTEYGRRLSPRLQFEGSPPFEKVFDDHRVYLRAMLGHDVENAVTHFHAKLDPALADDPEASLPAQVFVDLLMKLGKIDEAIDVAATYLTAVPESALICPGISEICQRGGRMSRLTEIARGQGNLVQFLASLLPASARP